MQNTEISTIKNSLLISECFNFSSLNYYSTLLTNSTKIQLLQLNLIIKSELDLFLINVNSIHIYFIANVSLRMLSIYLRIKNDLLK